MTARRLEDHDLDRVSDESAGRGSLVGPYRLAVGVALVTATVAALTAWFLDLPLRDPDGFLGPTYVRLPVIVGLMLAIDVLPRSVLRARSLTGVGRETVRVARERWPWHRLGPALVGLAAFYVTYVSYRNLKHHLPLLRPDHVDEELRELDRALTGGVDAAELLHDVLGTWASAHVLSWVYLAFLMFVPISLSFALVANGRSREGAWYVTALCLNWAIGTASYYMLPSMGPVYAEPAIFVDLPETGTSLLQNRLLVSRAYVLWDPHATERVQSIAAFASLHVSIVFTAALIAQLVLKSVVARALLWVFFMLTVISTIYFGWHYIVDDFAGLAIGGAAVALAAWGTGQFGPLVLERGNRDGAEPGSIDLTDHEAGSRTRDGARV